MIALAVLIMCTIPFIHVPTLALKNSLSCIEQLEYDRLSDLTYALVKERICMQEITWEELCSKRMRRISADDLSFFGKRMRRKCFLRSVGKKDKSGEEHRLATLKIFLFPAKKRGKEKDKNRQEYTYKFLVKKSASKLTLDSEAEKGQYAEALPGVDAGDAKKPQE